MVQFDLGVHQMLEVGLLLGQQEQQGLSRSVMSSAGTAYSMDVLLYVQWRVELDDPVHLRDIQSSSCYVRA